MTFLKRTLHNSIVWTIGTGIPAVRRFWRTLSDWHAGRYYLRGSRADVLAAMDWIIVRHTPLRRLEPDLSIAGVSEVYGRYIRTTYTLTTREYGASQTIVDVSSVLRRDRGLPPLPSPPPPTSTTDCWTKMTLEKLTVFVDVIDANTTRVMAEFEPSKEQKYPRIFTYERKLRWKLKKRFSQPVN